MTAPLACSRTAATIAALAACCVLTSCMAPAEPVDSAVVASLKARRAAMAPSNPNPDDAAAAPELPEPGAALPKTGPLELTLQQAVLSAIENNRALVVEKTNPAIVRTFEEQERAAFDPVLLGDYTFERDHVRPDSGVSIPTGLAREASGSLGVVQQLPTGTTVGADVSTDHLRTEAPGELNATRVGVSVTQALLRGQGLDVNLAAVRQARLDVLSSQYELRGFTLSLVAEVDRTYWATALAKRRIAIFEDSLKLAEQQLGETRDRIDVGSLAETELAAAQAEVALRQENLINARSDLAAVNLRLLRLLNPPSADMWQRDIVTATLPEIPEVPLDPVEAHVELAMQVRPELNQARLAIKRDDLEIVRTRNGLLPRLDLFISLGVTGYANSFTRSIRDLRDGTSYDALAGVAFEFPPLNRDARAQHERATLSRTQSADALGNLAQLVELDVRTAYVEVQRTREQVTATAATRKYQEESLRAETEKFRVGKSTSLLVAQVQRDLLSAQIGEVEAVVNFINALVALYQFDGSLLERHGVRAPGARAVAPDVTAAAMPAPAASE